MFTKPAHGVAGGAAGAVKVSTRILTPRLIQQQFLKGAKEISLVLV